MKSKVRIRKLSLKFNKIRTNQLMSSWKPVWQNYPHPFTRTILIFYLKYFILLKFRVICGAECLGNSVSDQLSEMWKELEVLCKPTQLYAHFKIKIHDEIVNCSLLQIYYVLIEKCFTFWYLAPTDNQLRAVRLHSSFPQNRSICQIWQNCTGWILDQLLN